MGPRLPPVWLLLGVGVALVVTTPAAHGAGHELFGGARPSHASSSGSGEHRSGLVDRALEVTKVVHVMGMVDCPLYLHFGVNIDPEETVRMEFERCGFRWGDGIDNPGQAERLLHAAYTEAAHLHAAAARSVSGGEGGIHSGDGGQGAWAAHNEDEWLVATQAAVEAGMERATFRTDPAVVTTCEHVQPEEGIVYLEVILEKAPWMLEGGYMERWRYLSQLGGGTLVDYGERLGPLNPTTIRYVAVAADIHAEFGSMDGWSIGEVGGGYGGQASVLGSLWSLKSYTVYDRAPPSQLACLFAEAAGVRTQEGISWSDGPPAHPQQHDLVISNYALTELSPPIHADYARLLVYPAARTYMLCNYLESRSHSAALWRTMELMSYFGHSIKTRRENAGLSYTPLVVVSSKGRDVTDRSRGWASPVAFRQTWEEIWAGDPPYV